MGLEQEQIVDGAAVVVGEVDREPRAAAARAAALRCNVSGGQRVVEIPCRDLEAKAAAHDRLATLELVEADIDARIVQSLEGALDAFAPDQVGNVLGGRARVLQERPIGAAGNGKNALGDDAQQIVGAAGEIGPNARVRGRRIERLPKIAGQGADQAREQRRLLDQR